MTVAERIVPETEPVGNLVVDSESRTSARSPTLFGARILLVEDNYLIAFDLRNELLDRGANVIGPAGELDTARSLARSEPRLAAAVIDIDLHGKSTFDLVDELVRRDVLVLFSTGYDLDVVPQHLRHLPRFVKPTPSREIANALAALLTERAALAETGVALR